ncbi:MAG: hypothetical protein BGO49_02305 [Planctomycetales bacterium 71-10]|nr:MAG: hypothetical protein BGO49_02305 [Planctomycetales bacterium 71-10]
MAEILLAYLCIILILGPGVILYGAVTAARGRVRLTRRFVLHGAPARLAGVAMIFVGVAMGWFMWSMVRYFPH